MGSAQKFIEIQVVGLVLVSLLMSQGVFGLPIEGEGRSSPADPAQACILPAGSDASSTTLPLISSVPSKQPADPAGEALKLPGGCAEARLSNRGEPASALRTPAPVMRRVLLCAIPMGAHAPPPLV